MEINLIDMTEINKKQVITLNLNIIENVTFNLIFSLKS